MYRGVCLSPQDPHLPQIVASQYYIYILQLRVTSFLSLSIEAFLDQRMGYFKAEKYVEVPNKDLLSWTFDDPKFDLDQPVRHQSSYVYCV